MTKIPPIGGHFVWTVVYITQSHSIAERLRERLAQEGVLSKLRFSGEKDENARNFEILVPESEVDEASELLSNVLTGR